ncbi:MULTISPECIES: DUF1002 domain-containing protein [unclassified Clostridium]|uniref:DUF1002 domain-containing protein n=1 Tax=unclassified Clostridium TaxID=2614128 RepID=UPI0032173595
MSKKFFKKLAMTIGILTCISIPTTAFADIHGEYPSGEILSFGSDLSDSQEAQLRKYFKAPDNIEAIYVDSKMALKQFGLDEKELANFTGGWYSSAYVKLLQKENGVTVNSSNLTLVTNDMLANALITSGILNAEVTASAPFEVTGESALAGILAGAENIMGGELSTSNKKAAQEEIDVSLDLAEEIGDTEASAIINEVKTAVIKDKPSSEEEIKEIIEKVEKKYDVDISATIQNNMVALMSNINDLDLDYSKLKDTLDKSASKFKDEMEALGKELKDSGFFDKLFSWISDFFSSLFN